MSEPFKFQFHTMSSGKNYKLVVDLLKKVIAENKLEIEVTEVPYEELNELRKDRERLASFIERLDCGCGHQCGHHDELLADVIQSERNGNE